jgi:hypothetical protein
MKKYFLFILFLFFKVFGQTEVKFEIDYKELPKDNKGNGFYSLKPATTFFYEDENYVVTDTCHGEFGGNIYFQDKSSKKQYSLEATCPLIINKLKNRYYLTTSLSHMAGFCELLEVENPKELKEVDILNYNNYKNIKSTIGAKPLIRIIGSIILLSFVYKEKLYHIVSNDSGTYIAERENAELKNIQALTNFEMYSYGAEVCKTIDNHYAAIFQNKRNQGFIEVYENKIRIILYK